MVKATKTRKRKKEIWSRITPHSPPIFQTSVYDYPDLESIDDYYKGLIPHGYLYSRNGLPNASDLEVAVAHHERAEGGIVSSSGMSSILILLLSNLKQGGSVVASSDVYGGTTVLLEEELPKLGIQTHFVDALDLKQVESSLERRPKLVLVETISNPAMRVCDLKEIAKLAHEHGAILAVDNTFATPFVARPLELGADIVVHSGTKYLGGHGDLTIGVLCSNQSKLLERMRQLNTRLGAIAGPFDCWLASRSISTWKLRVLGSCSNAVRLANYLNSRKNIVSRVYYPGLPNSGISRVNALKNFEKGRYGGMLSFDLKGGLEEAKVFVRALSKVSLTPSLGGVRTTISHPAKTSHRHISEQMKQKSGITNSMIRVSVGIEDYEEIEQDFENALSKARV